MKLIDLLRQELPKRGGWPEGATNAWQSTQDGEVYFCKENGEYSEANNGGRKWYFEITSDRGSKHAATREQYEAAMQQPVWNGEGLPPVGCECERSWCGDKWLACKILFVSDETVVVKLATREAAYGRCEVSFRPIRTEAERAIDEMVQLSGVSTGAAKILYDAGYRKV